MKFSRIFKGFLGSRTCKISQILTRNSTQLTRNTTHIFNQDLSCKTDQELQKKYKKTTRKFFRKFNKIFK